MRGLLQHEIGKRWVPPITQQAVHRHLRAAGWPAVEPALDWMETMLKDCFQINNPIRLSDSDSHGD
ncbi:hypothetical protein K8T06_15395 [bacterium]|nr:hypothetical protein [bacterium]